MVLLRQFLLLPLLSFLLLPGFYLNMLVLIFILVSRHCRFACSCCGFAYVLRGNEFTQSLLANFCYDSGWLHLFPCSFFLLKQLWAFFSPGSHRSQPLCWKPSPRFKDSAFLLADAVFICILGSEVLVFINGIFFLFKPPGKLHDTGPSIIMSPFGCRFLW